MLRLIFSQFSSVFVSQKYTQTILLKNIRRGITNLKCYSRNLKNVSKFFCETPFNDVVGFDCKKRQFCKNALHIVFRNCNGGPGYCPWGQPAQGKEVWTIALLIYFIFLNFILIDFFLFKSDQCEKGFTQKASITRSVIC